MSEMTGFVTLLFNPVAIFGILFFAFGLKNLITRRYSSAVIYLIASLCITLGGAWLWARVAILNRQRPIVEEQTNEETSNIPLHGTRGDARP